MSILVSLSLVYKDNEGFYWNVFHLDTFFRQIQTETIGQFEAQPVIRPEEHIVAEQEVDVRPKAAVDITEPPHCRCMLRDLGRRISVLNCIQDAVRPLLPAAASCLAQYMPHKGLLGEAVRMRSRVFTSCLLLRVKVNDGRAISPYGIVLQLERGDGGRVV